jgi:hypothetical protein
MFNCSHSHGRLLKHNCRWVTPPKGCGVARRMVGPMVCLSSSNERSGNTGWDWKRGEDKRNAHVCVCLCVCACVRVCARIALLLAALSVETVSACLTTPLSLRTHARISFCSPSCSCPFSFTISLFLPLSLSWSVFVTRRGAPLAQGYAQVSRET